MIDINPPRFSIIIPTRYLTPVLKDCIISLENQSADPTCFEVIVINDGNAFLTPDQSFFSGHPFEIRYYYQDHKGPAAARNLGIKKAKAETILFLDDDSLPTKGWLKAVTQAWESFPDFDGIGGCVISRPSDSICCRVNADFFNWYLKQYSGDPIHSFLATCNAGYRKSILQKVGNFDERFKNASGEDRDLNLKLLKAGAKLRLDENILVYHDRDLTFWSFTKKNYHYGKAAYEIYDRYPELKHLSTRTYVSMIISILKKYKTQREKFFAFLLLIFSQVLTFLGFLTALLLKQKKKAT